MGGLALALAFRWQLLVLSADSASGKSAFAESLFAKPYALTVEDAEHLDLKVFDRTTNDGIVLDNVNSWRQLLKWRAVLQARNAMSKGGQSPTNAYAYLQYLYGIPVVATVDLDAPDKHLVDPGSQKRSRWLLKNCVVVRLADGEKFYEEPQSLPPAIPNTYSLCAETVRKRRAEERPGSRPAGRPLLKRARTV